jgi:hypothetical protein
VRRPVRTAALGSSQPRRDQTDGRLAGSDSTAHVTALDIGRPANTDAYAGYARRERRKRALVTDPWATVLPLDLDGERMRAQQLPGLTMRTYRLSRIRIQWLRVLSQDEEDASGYE